MIVVPSTSCSATCPVTRYGWPTYSKSRVVFGAHRIAPVVPELIICEGEWNAIAIWQKLNRPAVAINGSSFSITQAKIIRDLTDRAIIFLDSDEAGEMATWGWTDDRGSRHQGVVEQLSPFVSVRVVPTHGVIPWTLLATCWGSTSTTLRSGLWLPCLDKIPVGKIRHNAYGQGEEKCLEDLVEFALRRPIWNLGAGQAVECCGSGSAPAKRRWFASWKRTMTSPGLTCIRCRLKVAALAAMSRVSIKSAKARRARDASVKSPDASRVSSMSSGTMRQCSSVTQTTRSSKTGWEILSILEHKPQIAVWSSGIRLFEELDEINVNYRGLSSRPFKIKRKGEKLDTKYHIAPADVDAGAVEMTDGEKKLAEDKYDLAPHITPGTYENFLKDLGEGSGNGVGHGQGGQPQQSSGRTNPFLRNRS